MFPPNMVYMVCSYVIIMFILHVPTSRSCSYAARDCSMFLQHDLQHGLFLVPIMQHELFLRSMKLVQHVQHVQPVQPQRLHIFRTQEQMALKLISNSPCSCSQPVHTIISFRSPPVQTTIIMSQYLHNPIYWIKTLTP